MYSMSGYFFTWPSKCRVSGKEVLRRVSEVKRKKKFNENRESFIMISFIIYARHKFYSDYEHTEDETTGNVLVAHIS